MVCVHHSLDTRSRSILLKSNLWGDNWYWKSATILSRVSLTRNQRFPDPAAERPSTREWTWRGPFYCQADEFRGIEPFLSYAQCSNAGYRYGYKYLPMVIQYNMWNCRLYCSVLRQLAGSGKVDTHQDPWAWFGFIENQMNAFVDKNAVLTLRNAVPEYASRRIYSN